MPSIIILMSKLTLIQRGQICVQLSHANLPHWFLAVEALKLDINPSDSSRLPAYERSNPIFHIATCPTFKPKFQAQEIMQNKAKSALNF